VRTAGYVAAVALVLLAAAWLVGARKGGFLGVDSHAVVPAPHEPETVQVYGGARRDVQIGEWRVAYVDEGSGPPVLLLHGCPFSSYEWHAVVPIPRRSIG
jgi:hypothetical protein